MGNMSLKSVLKTIKLNENNISMGLGVLVLIFFGFIVSRYLANTKTTHLPPRNPATEASEQTEKASGNGTHVVTKGESLWSIAEDEYADGYAWTQIAEVNNLENPGLIEVGQDLTIPQLEQEQPQGQITAEAASTEAPTDTSHFVSDTYTVVHGDNLWEIAELAYSDGYKWVDIARANNLANPNIIHAGNVLVIPK